MVIPVRKVGLYRDKYVENIKRKAKCICILGDREQKGCQNGGSSSFLLYLVFVYDICFRSVTSLV
jgi:hypothetical protein